MRPQKAILVTLFLIIFCKSASALTHWDTADLLAKADLVAVGDTVSVDQGVDSTRAQARLLQVFKGPEKAGNLVTIETAGGRVYIDESEPSFMTLQANLLFLQKTPTGYNCLNKADGQKIIRGKNVYPYHDNIAYSVPLEDYLKALEASLKTPAVK